MRGELEARNNQLSGVTLELEKLREDREQAIATLQAELEKVRGEVVEREVAIANLKTELEAVRGDIQLNLFPPEPTPELTPTPEPETIPTPEIIKPDSTPSPELTTEPFNSNLVVKVESPVVNSEPLIVTPTEVVQAIPLLLLDTIEGTVPRKVIMDRILGIDPATKINGQTITDAVLGNNQRLSELETTYGFKFVGYIMKGKSREYRYKLNP